MKPKSKDDGMRGEASISAFSRFGGGSSVKLRIDACNRALANPKLLPGQTLRKAHLLRARAAAYLEQGETASAMADLDAADAAFGPLGQEPLQRRSMGASLMLLRAIALAEAGDLAEAGKLAEQARGLRPYAVQVQLAAALIGHAARPIGTPSPSPWSDLARLEPALAGLTLAREAEVGNFAGVVAAAQAKPIAWPNAPSGALALLAPRTDFAEALDGSLHLAYAQAATGDVPGAQRTIALVREKVAALSPTTAAPAGGTADLAAEFGKSIVEPRLRLAEARIALAQGRDDEARAAIVGKLPLNAAALDLLNALARGKAAAQPAVVKPDDALLAAVSKQRGRVLGKLADTVLIAPESPRTLIDYKKSRPNILGALVGGALTMGTSLLGGIQKTQGFKSSTNADGSITVEYLGSTPSAPMVQEMTLLRAAELTRSASKPRFAIVARKDYSRFLTMSRHGIEESRTPVGYKTELTIRLLDDAAKGGPGFDAVEVIDALGPLYYQG